MSQVAEAILRMDAALARLGIRYAIGGGLALQHYAEPRFTNDVDLNLSAPFSSAPAVVEALAAAGYRPTDPPESWLPIAGVRMARDGDDVVVDLFFSFDQYHDRLMERAVTWPLVHDGAITTVPFLSAADLVVVKLSFNRGRDWVDVDAMIDAGTPLDVEYIEQQLVAWRGPTMYPRVAHLRQMLKAAERRTGGGPGGAPGGAIS